MSFIVDSYLSDKGYSSFCKEYSIVKNWKEIVGDKISSITVCKGVEKNILYVAVSVASWRNELHFLKKEILKKIKTEYNCQTITDIMFI